MFDDRIAFLSPGSLPGTVRPSGIRRAHFPRNPRIARFLRDCGLMKGAGEGVDRICNEMERSGGKAPVYEYRDSMATATPYGLKPEGRGAPSDAAEIAPKKKEAPRRGSPHEDVPARRKRLLDAMAVGKAYTFAELARMLMLKTRRARDLVMLLEMNGDKRREGRGHATRYLLAGSSAEGSDG